MSHRTRKGNRWVRRALCQAARAAWRKDNCYLVAFFYRHAGKHGVRKAIVELAHRILTIAFCLLRDLSDYREIGGDYFDRINPSRTRHRLVRRGHLDRAFELAGQILVLRSKEYVQADRSLLIASVRFIGMRCSETTPAP